MKVLNNKGITLVALVITIVILIILAGITMNALLSENGLITKAREGAAVYGEKQNEEERFFANFNFDNLISLSNNINNPSNPTNPEEPPEVTWRDLVNNAGINAANYDSFKNALFDSNNTETIIANSDCQDYILDDGALLGEINGDSTVRNVFLSSKSIVGKLKTKITIDSNDQIGLVPTLTSNTSTSDSGVTCGTASQSSYWYRSGRQAHAAFNGNTTNNSVENCWQPTNQAPSTGTYIRYQSTTKDTILTARVGTWDDNPNNSDKTWTTYVRGSNDGTTWNTISNATKLNVVSNTVTYFDYTINDFRPYEYYEVYYEAQDGDAEYVHKSDQYSCCFMFLQFYGLRDEDILQYYIDSLNG